MTYSELTVSVEGEGEKSVEEKIYLPFQPSTFLLSYLYAISNEIFRVGGHTIERVRRFCATYLIFIADYTSVLGVPHIRTGDDDIPKAFCQEGRIPQE